MRALLSVFDKTGILELGRGLDRLGWEILSTGGTLATLDAAGIPVTPVSEVTGFPEILDGRVKTLHPKIHGGLLGRTSLPGHLQEMRLHDIEPIALLAVNLYPFEATLKQSGITDEEAIEQIDIGGPAMLRAAAKNHAYVIVLTNPADYEGTLNALAAGEISSETRRSLAAKAFAHTSAYDSIIADYFHGAKAESFPDELTVAGRRAFTLRYGENPHQRAAAYHRLTARATAPGLLSARQLGGKELSYNNLLDGDAAWSAVQGWSDPAVAIVKHTIPCGLATGSSLLDAYGAALAGDPVSAFGGIVAVNRALDADTARAIADTFYEIVIAPSFAEDALEVLQRKKRLRLLELQIGETGGSLLSVRPIRGGLLVQEPDDVAEDMADWKVVSQRQPTDRESAALQFAWQAARHIKSNAIVIASEGAILGVGSGQPNRLESVSIAAKKAGERAQGASLASDAFFPFRDGIDAAASVGVAAIIQPGGSVKDSEVIAAADEHCITMIFTGRRHFLH